MSTTAPADSFARKALTANARLLDLKAPNATTRNGVVNDGEGLQCALAAVSLTSSSTKKRDAIGIKPLLVINGKRPL